MDFRYKARNSGGGVQTGIVKATDETLALDLLKRNNLDPFFLEAAPIKGFSFKLESLLSRVTSKDLVVFSRQLALLIESNVPIIRALKTMANQTQSAKLAEVATEMAVKVEEGSSFSDALAAYPKQFDSFFVNIVKSGEASGNLEHSLVYLADHVEKAHELKSKIKSAMLYPGFIIFAFSAIFFFLTVKVLPELTTILKDSGVELPVTTRAIIVISDFMKDHWILVLVAMIAFLIGLVFYFKTEAGKKNFDYIVLKIPVIGMLFKYTYIARFAENLRVLLDQGVSIVKSFSIMANVMNNEVYRDIIVEIMQDVEKGKSMTLAMRGKDDVFPSMVPQMIKVGEEAGRTTEILKNIERFYTKEVDNMTENMTKLIEPLLIVIMGVGTGILVAAIIMPIYDMASAM